VLNFSEFRMNCHHSTHSFVGTPRISQTYFLAARVRQLCSAVPRWNILRSAMISLK
jgi:hypothetical protein